jgi:hypothetical protein
LTKICLISFLILAVSIAGCSGFADLTRLEPEAFPRALQCRTCHISIYNEWASSSHAGAFIDPKYKASTDDYLFTECTGCHAPQASLTNMRPGARQAFRGEGVTCVSCHLEEGRLAGPLKPSGLGPPHQINIDEDLYASGKFCGRCHEGTFREWDAVQSDDKHSCQFCHMTTVARKTTQASHAVAEILVALESVEPQKRHIFRAVPIDMPVEPFSITLKSGRNSSETILNLQNHLPHYLPTGDFGVRIITVEIFVRDRLNRYALVHTEELIRELKTAIAPHAGKSWTVTLPQDAQGLKVQLTRYGRNLEETAAVFTKEVQLP